MYVFECGPFGLGAAADVVVFVVFIILVGASSLIVTRVTGSYGGSTEAGMTLTTVLLRAETGIALGGVGGTFVATGVTDPVPPELPQIALEMLVISEIV